MKKILLLGVMFVFSVATLVGCKKAEDKVYEVQWTVPAGFSSKDELMYTSASYPIDGSNIVYSVAEETALRTDISKEELENEMRQLMYATLATEVEIEVVEYEYSTIEGRNCLIAETQCAMAGKQMTQLVRLYDCNGSMVTLVYTWDNKTDWEVLFRESAAGIRLVETEQEKEK